MHYLSHLPKDVVIINNRQLIITRFIILTNFNIYTITINFNTVNVNICCNIQTLKHTITVYIITQNEIIYGCTQAHTKMIGNILDVSQANKLHNLHFINFRNIQFQFSSLIYIK